MPSIRYYNQTAPFWDFIANLENTGANHPFFSAYNQDSREGSRGSHPSAPPPPHHDGPTPPTQDGPPPPPEGAQPPPPHSPHDHPFGRRAYSGHGGRRGPGGRCGNGPFPAWGGWGGNDFDLNKLTEFFASHFGPNSTDPTQNSNTSSKDSAAPKDFSPPADVFDTEESYIIHISLPGAKKEDVGVNWDADKSEVSVAGVIYRPGDEEFLKTLALDERQIGVFERKVRLGSRATPAAVDDDGMSAKMEDGILVVTIPKRDAGYVEVKKVDIE
ncbi:MAG: hypothetical protein Q9216_006005 [Gyalolechia sp. 2 TL-2023]